MTVQKAASTTNQSGMILNGLCSGARTRRIRQAMGQPYCMAPSRDLFSIMPDINVIPIPPKMDIKIFLSFILPSPIALYNFELQWNI